MADIDVMGHKISPLAAGAIGIGGVAAAFLALRQYKAAGSGSSIDQLTGLPVSQDNVTDPLTGESYLAEAQQYGSVQAAEAAFGGNFGSSGVTSSGTIGTSAGSGTGSARNANYADNGAWSQAVESGLAEIGYPALDVADALGAYLAQIPLTSGQARIIRDAIAEYGQPPSGLYQVILSGSGTGTTPPAARKAPSSAPGLSASPHAGFADFSWSKVTGATGYELQVTGTGGKGTGTGHYDQQHPGTRAEHVALPKGAYKALVRAVNSAGTGPWSVQRTVTIK